MKEKRIDEKKYLFQFLRDECNFSQSIRDYYITALVGARMYLLARTEKNAIYQYVIAAVQRIINTKYNYL